ncbi:EAL domain-containing protein [Enterobacter sp. LM3]|jgi:sensor c-di-GMP phosphodiesterase-like protein|uniref:cyclic-guanylate-specific phosphodiesterase n=1 Tax=Enterobacter mori TaxID=539813 RepID=A0A7T0H215_9ENTR|nr:EAL domain-containing protein [Enterobacter mori]QPK01556.1 EAL domain-containing protein [Enterobacter mori]BBS36078.1 cyclic diguanylate phosphodiesterase [Enterobacter cloacae]
MKTRHLVSLVTGILIVSVLVPICLSIWLAHRQAEEQFVNVLDNYASRVLMRTDRVVAQAKDALTQLQNYEAPPCSRQHLREMRLVAFSRRYVQEVIYVDNLKPVCSSLEQISNAPAYPPPMRITRDGYSTWLSPQNDLGFNHYMAIVGRGHYLVMIDPDSLVDVLPFSTTHIDAALIGDARNLIFASSNTLDHHIHALLGNQKITRLQYNGSMYITKPVPELGFTVVAWAALKPLDENWHQQLLIWLPAGILISLLAAFFMLRLLRHIQSPRNRLQDAINSRDFVVHYQPIVALGSGKMVGAEALARWPQPDGSHLSPDIFVSLAEQTGLISQLTQLIIEKVFEDMGHWLHLHPDQHISINLAPDDLTSGKLPPLLHHLLNKWQVHPGQIALELTERGFADPKVSAPAIAAFRRSGHAIYIDDFGTGYSSLSYLQDLDVDTLKIDKSFVNALEYKNVTPHIIEMAKSLKLAMVAEGIETAGQLAWLHRHGVQYGQGWYYSKAMPKVEFILWAEYNLENHPA